MLVALPTTAMRVHNTGWTKDGRPHIQVFAKRVHGCSATTTLSTTTTNTGKGSDTRNEEHDGVGLTLSSTLPPSRTTTATTATDCSSSNFKRNIWYFRVRMLFGRVRHVVQELQSYRLVYGMPWNRDQSVRAGV